MTSPWGNEDTQLLIDILAKYNVKATFFVVGEWVDKYPESVKALSDAGHEVMNHSSDHAHFNALSATEIARNITACNQKVEAVTGKCPTLFRPPYGEYDDHVIAAVRGLGMEPIQWDVDGYHTASRGGGRTDCGHTQLQKPDSLDALQAVGLFGGTSPPPVCLFSPAGSGPALGLRGWRCR